MISAEFASIEMDKGCTFFVRRWLIENDCEQTAKAIKAGCFPPVQGDMTVFMLNRHANYLAAVPIAGNA